MPIHDRIGISLKATYSSFAWHFFSVIHNDALVRRGQRCGALASASLQNQHIVLVDLNFVMVLFDDVFLVAAACAAAADVSVITQRRRRRAAVRLNAVSGT